MDTNWYVLTGAPRSGMDEIQNRLEGLGYKVSREAARRYIDQEIAKGRTIEEIRADEADFQRKVMAIKVEDEKNLPADQLTFMNRGKPDSIAYYEVTARINPEEARKQCERGTYKRVFYLEALPYVKDYARTETEEERDALQPLLVAAYESLGYEVVIVPATLSAPERVQLILERL